MNLEPGDCLLYGPSAWYDRVIEVKTWSHVVHCEAYIGNGMSVASRNGVGVNSYELRKDDLAHVLRPHPDFKFDAAMKWFREKARGQKYDWLGLLCFTLAVNHGSKDRMFCSEFLTRWYRVGGVNAFHPGFDADKVAPGNFLMSPVFDWVNQTASA